MIIYLDVIDNETTINCRMTYHPKFPLADVILREVTATRRVTDPAYADDFWQISQTEFAMQVEGVGDFYACHGREAEYAPAPQATLASIELFLNGSVYGAILHQRNILPMHGSSFVWNNEGIMLCGDSGAGKSSLTAAFCIAGAQFLTDDVTPIVFTGGIPQVMPLSDRIKLRDDSLDQLAQERSHLTEIRPGESKYYFPMKQEVKETFALNRILVIIPEETSDVEFIPLRGIEAFTVLRNEVYRFEYLEAMPGSEISYLEKLLGMVRRVKVEKIVRPRDITIQDMAGYINQYMKYSGQ